MVSLEEEIDLLVQEDIYPIVERRRDQPIPGSPTKAMQQSWFVRIPTMKLKTIPQAFGTDPVATLRDCVKEYRRLLEDPQYRHIP